METNNETQNEISNAMMPNSPNQRHGCVTAYLVFMIVVNSLTALLYLLFSEAMREKLMIELSTSNLMLLGICGVANVAFAVLLLRWKRWGFWGFAITSVITLIINLTGGIGIGQSLLGLIGVVILFGILQIKNQNVTAWDKLE